MIRTVSATRYVTPLREGGSLPAIVEADDLGLYVLKFRGAGQGPLALVAELIAGEIGRALGLRVPGAGARGGGRGARPQRAGPGDPRPAQGQRGAEPRGWTTCRARSPSIRPPATRSMPDSPRPSSGSTPSSPTSTARRGTPTCSGGTRRSTSSTTAPRSTSTTTGRSLATAARSRFPADPGPRAAPLGEPHRGGRPPPAPAAGRGPVRTASSSRSRTTGCRPSPAPTAGATGGPATWSS